MCVWAQHNIHKIFQVWEIQSSCCLDRENTFSFPKLHTNNPALIHGLYLPLVLGTKYICDITIITSSRIVATSQMHPTHARKTFPCFDEPAMRAVFYITLIHDRGTMALSNGMEIGQFYPKNFRFTHNDYVKYGNVNTRFNKSGSPMP